MGAFNEKIDDNHEREGNFNEEMDGFFVEIDDYLEGTTSFLVKILKNDEEIIHYVVIPVSYLEEIDHFFVEIDDYLEETG